HAIYQARTLARLTIAEALEQELWQAFRNNHCDDAYQPSALQIAQRSLKNTALAYLMLLGTDDALAAAVEQFDHANNMTDVLAAFNVILNSEFGMQKQRVLKLFYERWQHESLVVNQWFMAQAVCSVPGTLDHVKGLMTHPAFDIKNPNKARALIGAFCGQNAVNFHQRDGAGYRFLVDQVVELNRLNPQMASRLLGPLTKWKKYTADSRALMKAELERIMAEPDLSRDVFEVVSKSLKA
ncbi:MAG: aminopeptidase N, partial [Oceanicoccus sp.]|uniref:aminopeptidase N C-terminal domain-containing protein n=1 Tax=Oceanicoccus sp. TaxID=2691044 RepID=UPI0026247E55